MSADQKKTIQEKPAPQPDQGLSDSEAAAMRERFQQQRAARATAASMRTYVVKSGDSLSKIAKELLGDAARWPEIHEANKDQISDPNVIRPGQELKIPAE